MTRPVNGFFCNMDKICDKIPVISSLSNLVNLFQKALFIPCAEIKGRYYSYLQQKSAIRCICLLIPVIGNLAIAIHDFSKSNARVEPSHKIDSDTIGLKSNNREEHVDILTILPFNKINSESIDLRSGNKSLAEASSLNKDDETLSNARVEPSHKIDSETIGLKSNNREEHVDISTILPPNKIDSERIALRSMSQSLASASPQNKDDETLVRAIVEQDGCSLEHASAHLKNHKNTVLAAVAQNGMALQFASDELKKDKDIVLKAVAQDGMAFQFAGGDLWNDLDVAKAAAKQNKGMMVFVSPISWFRNHSEIKEIIEK